MRASAYFLLALFAKLTEIADNTADMETAAELGELKGLIGGAGPFYEDTKQIGNYQYVTIKGVCFPVVEY